MIEINKDTYYTKREHSTPVLSKLCRGGRIEMRQTQDNEYIINKEGSYFLVGGNLIKEISEIEAAQIEREKEKK